MPMMQAVVKMLRTLIPDKPDRSSAFAMFHRKLPVRVTADVALSVSAVWACVNFIAGGIAQLPWRVYKKDGAGNAVVYETHAASWLLSTRPNAETSAFNFVFTMLYHVLIYGNFYAEIERDPVTGRPLNLWQLDPGRVTPDRTEDGRLIYRVADLGGPVGLEPMNVFHISGLGFDGIMGYSVIEFAARNFAVAVAAEQYGNSFFGNSGVPSGVLSHPKKLSKPAQDRLEEKMRNTTRGVYGSQETMILEEGMEYKSIGLPPEQAQFLATRKHTVEDVARWFGVPPSKIAHFEKISYNSAEQLSLDVVNECLMPWICRIEQEANFKLLSNNWGGTYTKFDLRAAMRTTHTERALYYRHLFTIGALSINDIREKEDLKKVEFGDVHLVPLNMTLLKYMAEGEHLPSAIAAAKAPPDAPEDDDTVDTVGDGGGDSATKSLHRRLLAQLDMTLLEIEDHSKGGDDGRPPVLN